MRRSIPSIEHLKKTIPLEPYIASVIELKRGKGLCPFHDDHDPSLSVKEYRWRCWACGEGGDLIDFTKKYHGLDTKGAIKILADWAGIKQSKPLRHSVRAREYERELLRSFRGWERMKLDSLARLLREIRHVVTTWNLTESDLDLLQDLIRNLSWYEYIYDILASKDNQDKFELYKWEMGL